MSTTAYMKKHFGELRPADAISAEYFDALPNDVMIEITWSRRRNIKHNQWFHVLIGFIHKHQSYYATPQDLKAVFKVKLGHFTPVQMRDGSMMASPKPLSFSSMDQDEFQKFTDAARALVREFLPGITDQEVSRELEELIS